MRFFAWVFVLATVLCGSSCNSPDGEPIKVRVEHEERIELIRIELRQEELTLRHMKGTVEILESASGCVPEARIREAKYQFGMQKLKVEYKRRRQ